MNSQLYGQKGTTWPALSNDTCQMDRRRGLFMTYQDIPFDDHA